MWRPGRNGGNPPSLAAGWLTVEAGTFIMRPVPLVPDASP